MHDIFENAKSILHQNDMGTYTVPTHGLYPFQWNWDSCFVALGFSTFDEKRAWQEMETLFAHQWQDGMLPHIIFHQKDAGYFPGPDVWQTGTSVPTSGITQPPVAGFVVKKLVDQAKDKNLAHEKARKLIENIHAWHEWFYAFRDPKNLGLVSILHPWESGRDNAADWDEPLDFVPDSHLEDFSRRDTDHANPEHRPSDAQYRRYISLVEIFKAHHWDNRILHEVSPFCVVDPGFNAILLRSIADLGTLAEELGLHKMAAQSKERLRRGIDALESCWSHDFGQYVCANRITGKLITSPSVGGILPLFCDIHEKRALHLIKKLEQLSQQARYLIPSQPPDTPHFEPKRYWRGPAWLIVNYMVSTGLAYKGIDIMASQIVTDSLQLVKEHGFAEYYDPMTGEPCGGTSFSWTAAIALVLQQLSKDTQKKCPEKDT